MQEAIERLAAAGLDIVDVDPPELDLVDDALGAIILREAWDVHRETFEREADGYGPGTSMLLELGSKVDDDAYRAALADRDRVAAGFSALFEQVDVLAGPTVAYAAPAEDPPVGTPEGDLEGRFTGPYNLGGQPGDLAALRACRGQPAGRPAARGRGRERRLAAVRGKALRGGVVMRVAGCQLDAARGVPARRRPDRAPARLGGAARVTSRSRSTRSSPSASSVEAAEPLGVPVLPSLPYGITPYFAAYPGSPTPDRRDLPAVVRELLDVAARPGLPPLPARQRPRRQRPRPRRRRGLERRARRARRRSGTTGGTAPRTWEVVQSIDPDASHASWLENFPWTRLPGVAQPQGRKPMADIAAMRVLDPAAVRELLGDGSLGGLYERPDEDVLLVWQAGVEEVRDLLENAWARA